MKKKNNKLLIKKATLSKMGLANINGGQISGHQSCNPTCARSCNQSCEACASVLVNMTCPQV